MKVYLPLSTESDFDREYFRFFAVALSFNFHAQFPLIPQLRGERARAKPQPRRALFAVNEISERASTG